MSSINLKEKLAEINKLVEPIIKKLLTDDVEKSNAEVAFYQCKVGGKRIRPALIIISGQVFSGDINELLYPAASVEILHNATLIIDDIIDHSDFRRNKPTCWNKFGKSIAECTSMVYFASIFAGLSHVDNSSKLIDLYSRTLKTIVDGEIEDILFERSGREDEAYVVKNRYKMITKDDYFEMISRKTAILLQTCCEAGAICANASDDQVKIIGNFGFNLGMAFQICDDILDIFGDEKEFGKKIGKDIIEKKMGNFVIISAIDQLKLKERNIICNFLTGSKEILDEDIATVTTLIEKTRAKRDAKNIANTYIQNAYKALEKLPQNKHREELEEVAKYIIDRKE
jgi:geranylgeranyl diphosphate synthase type I